MIGHTAKNKASTSRMMRMLSGTRAREEASEHRRPENMSEGRKEQSHMAGGIAVC